MENEIYIGIDEVGRGALAGPVGVAAVILKKSDFQKLNPKNSHLNLPPLKDSKKLTPYQRQIWFDYLTNKLKLPYAVAMVSSKVIDKINISKAANLAATRAIYKLLLYSTIVNYNSKMKLKIFLDGGLYLYGQTKNQKRQIYPLKKLFKGNPFQCQIQTLTRADEKIKAVKIASIIAKVSRDKKMLKIHKQYPHYDFLNNKGYGTKKHLDAIKKFGWLSFHRLTFLKNHFKI